MKKAYLTFIAIITTFTVCFAQLEVPNYGSGGPAGNGSWLRFNSGGDPTSIQENWGLNILGNHIQPVKVVKASFLVGYMSQGQDFGEGNALISNKVGIGTTSPLSQLHMVGEGDAGGMINAQNTSPNYYSGMNMFNESGGLAASFQYGNSATGGLSNTFFFGNRSSGSTVIVSGPSATPLLTVLNGGNVGIGNSNPQNKLDVNGIIHSRQVNVDANGWPDYVFKPSYHAMELNEVAKYLKKNRHLPEIPSAEQIEKDGLNLGEMNAKLLKKVEELTLYLLDQDKRNKAQQLQNSKQQSEIDLLKIQVRSLAGNRVKTRY